MTEWSVVLVIVTLIGIVGAVARPIIKLNTSITKLTVTLENTCGDVIGLSERHDRDMQKNSENHARLWQHNEIQDAQLKELEKIVFALEGKHNGNMD